VELLLRFGFELPLRLMDCPCGSGLPPQLGNTAVWVYKEGRPPASPAGRPFVFHTDPNRRVPQLRWQS